jgi:hypothetical protein
MQEMKRVWLGLLAGVSLIGGGNLWSYEDGYPSWELLSASRELSYSSQDLYQQVLYAHLDFRVERNAEDLSSRAAFLEQCLQSQRGVLQCEGSLRQVEDSVYLLKLDLDSIIRDPRVLPGVSQAMLRTENQARHVRTLFQQSANPRPIPIGRCIGQICVGSVVEFVMGPYRGHQGRVQVVEPQRRLLTVQIARLGRTIQTFDRDVRLVWGGPIPGPVPMPIPGPIPGLLRATGEMDQIPFHFSGRSPEEVHNQCLNFTRYYSIQWVYTVRSNQLQRRGPLNALQACQVVVQSLQLGHPFPPGSYPGPRPQPVPAPRPY